MSFDPVLVKEFLSASDCDMVREFFSLNIDHFGYGEPGAYWTNRLINEHRLNVRDDASVKMILGSIKFRALYLALESLKFDRLFPQGIQIVSWPAGSQQDLHVDSYFKSTSVTGIVYLNDDFFGGETQFPTLDLSVKPTKGALLLFDGSSVPHSVRAVERGARYTVAMWFTKNIDAMGF